MNRFHALCLALAGPAAIAAPGPGASAAEVRFLADSTQAERWQLANGLRVVVRHIPRARAAAITFVIGGGTDHDPAGREGFAALVAEAAYYSATGDVPERTREEMEGLRPLGWSLKVTGDNLQMGEVVTPAQLPGTLHQMAQRFRGVTLTEPGFQRALAAVKTDLAERYGGRPDHALYYGARELGRTGNPERARRFATGRGLAGVKAEDVKRRLAQLLVPANTVLGIAGNVGEVDLARLIENELGALPAGAEIPHDTTRFRAADLVEVVAGVTAPVGTVGIIAPAITDTSHSSFYLHTLLFGSVLTEGWGRPDPPLTSRLQYPVLDDPGLVRFYPPIDQLDTIRTAEEFNLTVRQVPTPEPDSQLIERFRRGILWLFGGPLEVGMVARARVDPSVVYNISAAEAARERWAGAEFWDGYRERLARCTAADIDRWRGWFLKRDHQVRLAFRPAKPGDQPSRR